MKNTIATTKNRWMLPIIFLLLISLFSACAKEEQRGQEQGMQTIQVNKDEQTLFLTMVQTSERNPLLTKEVSVDYVWKLVYEGLYGLDEDYNPVPKLAESSSFSKQNKILTLTLREDVTWHSGKRVSSSDVKYTVDFLKAHPESAYHYMTQNILKVDVLNDRTVAFHLVNNDPFARFDLLFPLIAEGSGGDLPFQPNGTGKYRFAGFKNIEVMDLSVNDSYYGKHPKIEKIQVKMVPSEQIRSNLFLATDSDFIETTKDELGRYSYDVFEESSYSNLQYEMLIFNSSRSPFNLKDNRRAVVSAIDRDMILNRGYRVEKSRNPIFIPEDSIFHVKRFPLRKDSSLMREVWKAEKVKSYHLLVDSENPTRFAAANLIRQDLKKAGLDVEVIGASGDTLKAKLKAGNFDMALVGYRTGLKPNLMRIFKRGNIFFCDSSPFQKLISDLSLEEGEENFAKRYEEFQVQFAEEAFYGGFAFLDNYMIKNRRIGGRLKPNVYDIYNGIEELTVENKYEIPVQTDENEKINGMMEEDIND